MILLSKNENQFHKTDCANFIKRFHEIFKQTASEEPVKNETVGNHDLPL